MWELLQWAYAKQKVNFASDSGYSPCPPFISSTARVCGDLAAGAVIRGGVRGSGSTAHEDAYIIHDYVCRLFPAERDLVIQHAEKSAEPDWCPRLPELVVVPVMRGNGQVKMLKDKRGKAVACCIDYDGFPAARIAEAHAFAKRTYEQWHTALRILREAIMIADGLKRWRVTGVGAEREPWAVVLSTPAQAMVDDAANP